MIHMILGQGGGRRAIIQVLGVEAGNQYQYVRSTSPIDSDDFCHLPNGIPHEESPTSILEIMTSFPVLGGLLLSPLPYELLYLTEKEKWEDSSCGSVHKKVKTVNRHDIKVDRNEKKPKNEGNLVPPELKNINIVCDGIGGVTKQEADTDNLSCEEPLSNGMRVDFRKGMGKAEVWSRNKLLSSLNLSHIYPLLFHPSLSYFLYP
ncbi:unnamed protein product [Lactuca saligna]|uniref:Uncharacterized protein n=1 Tax=Lactuca saligna TaxID=75948 RepID=A0AA35VZ44_LACSI|nr:unnamed protein product [Lactuca saligna]